MDFSAYFVALYDQVLKHEKRNFFVNDNQIRDAIRNMKEVYKPKPDWELDPVVLVANYNDAAHRCAYVHKYALCYTGMVYEILRMVLAEHNGILNYLNSKNRLNICCLGGGPGTEVVGALSAIFEYCQFIPCHVKVVDYDIEWERTFSLILQEIQNGNYGGLSNMMSPSYFRYEYLRANLLSKAELHQPKVRQSVMSADFLMMIKFVSAAACKDTLSMLWNVFDLMQPGALLLFIDNAAGGFQETIDTTAEQYGMVTIFGPLKHHDYENPAYSITRFGYTSQSKTKVTIQIFQKAGESNFGTTRQLRNEYFDNQRSSRNVSNTIQVQRTRSRSRNRNRKRRNYTPEGGLAQEEQESGCCSII